MIYHLYFKTPDVLDQLVVDRSPELQALIDKYMKFGELIYVKFDTTEGTVTVEPFKGTK